MVRCVRTLEPDDVFFSYTVTQHIDLLYLVENLKDIQYFEYLHQQQAQYTYIVLNNTQYYCRFKTD